MALLLSRNLPALGRSAACGTLRRQVFLAPVRAASDAAGEKEKAETVGKGMLAKHLAEDQNLSVKKATEIIDAVLDDIMLSVAEGKVVTIPGFGSWKRRSRAARKGRNPKTGEPLDIPEGVAPAFSAGNVFKGVVKQGNWEAYEQWAEEEKAAAAAKKAAKKK
jgi:DNA-binding protein HU-beta